MTTVRSLRSDELDAAGALLGRAFSDQPLFTIVLPDPVEALACTAALFTANMHHASEYGGAWGAFDADDGLVGTAFTMPRPEPEISEADAARYGYPPVFERWGEQLGPVGEYVDRAIKRYDEAGESWIYLSAIGVEPGRQGQGFGSRLMRHLVMETAATGKRFALMTDVAIDVPFYERVGFTVDQYDPETPLGIPSWSLSVHR